MITSHAMTNHRSTQWASLNRLRRFSHPRPVRPLSCTTDFSALRGARVLVLLDEDNLRISLKSEHGLELSHHKVLRRLERAAARISPWAVLSTSERDWWREICLRASGWRTLSIPHEMVATHNGLTKKANADMDLCFEAGSLVAQEDFDVVLIGSGDGDLCVSVARGIRRARAARFTRVLTLSVPGTSSRRLLERTDLFDGNIPVGADLTQNAFARCG